MTPSTKTMKCRCGQSVAVGFDAESATCGRCLTGRRADPPKIADAMPPPANSSLIGFIANNCANNVSDRCIVRDPERCIVVQGLRCDWFERAVLPLAKIGQAGNLSRIRQHYAIGQFSQSARVRLTEARSCPECGNPIPPRRRLCDDCTTKNHRQSARETRMRKKGFGACQLSENTIEKPQQNGGILMASGGGAVVGSRNGLFGD